MSVNSVIPRGRLCCEAMTATEGPARRGRPPSGGREAMLAAALDLLREKGAARLTTREVAERAGVSEGSVFYHFKDRAGLLVAVISDGVRAMGEPPGSTGRARTLRDLIEGFTATVESFLDEALLAMVGAQSDAQLRAAMVEFLLTNDAGPHRGVEALGAVLRRLQEAGQVRGDVDTSAAAYLVLSTSFQRVCLRLMIGTSYDEKLPPRADVIDVLVTALSPPT